MLELVLPSAQRSVAVLISCCEKVAHRKGNRHCRVFAAFEDMGSPKDSPYGRQVDSFFVIASADDGVRFFDVVNKT